MVRLVLTVVHIYADRQAVEVECEDGVVLTLPVTLFEKATGQKL